ncbi:MAG: HAD family phosphatase [Alphaproteobacteria bacterium]|nr:HAD family phosphatase [Alphaproteobacteria bacterium]
MLIIFDCDSVLIDSMPLHNEVESAAYSELGIHIAPAELAVRFAGIPITEEFKILERETGIAIPENFEETLETQKADIFTARLKATDGTAETLARLSGTPRCVASGSRMKSLNHTLGITGLYDDFAPHIFSSEMVARGKPHPDLFLYAAQKMATAPADCVVIEDATSGVKAAKAAGMRVLGYVGGSHCSERHAGLLMECGAERTFADMRRLPEFLAANDG